VVLIVGGAWLVLSGPRPSSGVSATAAVPDTIIPVRTEDLEPITLASLQRNPHIVFQSVLRDAQYAQTAVVPLDAPAEMRVYTGLVCERVSFAAGHGICLAAKSDADTTYYARLFGSDFIPTAAIQLDGTPTYAAVSPDGTLAAASVLLAPVTEINRLPPSKTIVINTSSATPAADLDTFDLLRDGQPVPHTTLDLWGMTFKADGDGFFASIRLSGNVFLIEGSLRDHSMTVREPGVSAPSLSAGGDQIAYARLISSVGPTWRFHVLDLGSGADTELAETRSIDDQMTWIDKDRVAYGLSTDTWIVNADGTGTPAPFLFDGLSTSVVRP
jgi:hypothetical protein